MYFVYFSLGLNFATCFIHCHVQEGHVPSVRRHTSVYAISLLIVYDLISVQCLLFFQFIETSMKYRHLKLILGYRNVYRESNFEAYPIKFIHPQLRPQSFHLQGGKGSALLFRQENSGVAKILFSFAVGFFCCSFSC